MNDVVLAPEPCMRAAATDTLCIEICGFEASSEEISLRIPSLTVESGSFCALVAKSGGGKSVLLSVLTGHLLGPWMRRREATRFDRFVIGKTRVALETFAFPAKLRASLRGENLIYLPQKFPDDRSMRRRCLSEMADIVGAIAPNCPRDIAKERLTLRCRKLHLESVLQQSLKDLSGGERKRVEIIARLCGVESQSKEEKGNGVVFLLDEPTTGLDVAAQRQYFLFLKETRKLFEDIDITFVTATHALSLLEEGNEEPIFDSVLYVRKEDDATGRKRCELAYCGSAHGFVHSDYFVELNGKSAAPAACPPSPAAPEDDTITSPPSKTVGNVLVDAGAPAVRNNKSGFSAFLSTFDEELRRANGKQFEGKSKRSVFVIPLLVGLIVFAAFLARAQINPERFIFFSTIYAFWIGIFNSCQIVNGAVASGEWNYWVLALRRSFFGYILANALVSFLLSLVQVAVFAGAVLLFSYIHGENSLRSVFIARSELPTYFIEHVAGLPANVLIFLLFFSSLAMAVVAGVGVGTLISCTAKDTLGALKLAVGVVVISMVSSTTVLKSESSPWPVSPPLYLKVTSAAPFLSAPATASSNVTMSDLESASAVLSRLKIPSNEVFHYVRGRLKESTRDKLDRWQETTDPSDDLKQALVDDLNALIRGNSIWDETRFADVGIDWETRELLESDPTGNQLARLNRLLLADAFSNRKALRRKMPNAGFWPHLLEDISYLLPQRYFFNIGRVLDMDVLQAAEGYHRKNEHFEYKLDTGGLAKNWRYWKQVTNEERAGVLRSELAEEGEFLNEKKFLPMILGIIGIEAIACCALSAVFFLVGTLIATRNNNHYEIH